ncbi:mechanosensitive ion channel family protein [Helicobacter bizzozeronii]|uniref:mechanosensitive ion channel domain-containing protein n=1 Tax=Helicobacter bizzozeronii TaxID=56877 RepID=UPI000CEF4F0D|nr:mechanosensitive ion channel domain-containing protein [Helicobacter bizzozeronii]
MDIIRLLVLALAFLCTLLSANSIQQDLQNKPNIIQKQLQNNDNIWLKELGQHEFQIHQKDTSQIIVLNHTSQTPQQQEKVLKSDRDNPFENLVQRPPISELACFLLLLKNTKAHEEELKKACQNTLLQFNSRIQKFFPWIFIITIFLYIGVLLPLMVTLPIHLFVACIAKEYGWNHPYKIRKGFDIFLNMLFISILIILILLFYNSVSALHRWLASIGIGLVWIKVLVQLSSWLTMRFFLGFDRTIDIGDRLQIFNKDGSTSTGYIVDIRTFYFVLYEDITLDTYLKNEGRAGRFFTVPTYRIFTSSIAIYDRRRGKIIWDSLDFVLTIESNYKKTIKITRRIARLYSIPYRETAEQQYQESRTYAMQHMDPTPKIFVKSEKEGVHLCISYITDITDPDETLELRSKIFIAIVKLFSKTSDISIVKTSEKES